MKKSLFSIILIFVFSLLFISPLFASLQLISEKQEIEIGKDVAKELEKKYGVYENEKWQKKINSIGKKIAKQSDRPNLPYKFKMLNTKEINAFSVPGGFIYVTKGLINMKISDQEMANVIGHEVAHASKRHAMKQVEVAMGMSILLNLATDGKAKDQITYQVLQLLVQNGFSRDMEYEADRVGAEYAYKAKYTPWGMIFFLGRLQKMEKGNSAGDLTQWFSTHPPTDQRIEKLKAQMKEMGVEKPSQNKEN